MHNYTAEYEVMCIFRVLQQKSSEELTISDGLTVDEFEHLYQCLELRWEIVVRMNLIELVCYITIILISSDRHRAWQGASMVQVH